MSVLDDFKLYYERFPHETKELLVNSAKRAKRVKRTMELLKRAEEAAGNVFKWRLFKRVGDLESKVDKPFIHDSGLTQYIDDEIERRLSEFKTRKAVKKS